MKRIADWIKNHQVAAFFISTYAMTWTGLFLAYFLFSGNDIVLGLLFPFILFSPALSAMVISGVAEPHPRRDSGRSRWIVFFLSWLLASTVLILYAWKLQEMALGVGVIVIYCIWGLFPAWMLSNAYARTPGIRKQFSTLLRPRGSALWYMAIFLVYPGILLLSVWITRLLGGEVPSTLDTLGFEAAAIAVVLDFLRGFFMTGGINEESGWRGFALPRLQARYSVLASSLIVGVLWALWHLPYDLPLENWRESLAWFVEYRLFWRVVFGVILTWLYNRTNGSLLAPVLFHPVMNAFGNAFFGTAMSRILCIVVVMVAIVSDRMWKKLPPDHPAVYRDPAPDSEASAERQVPVLIYG